MDFGVLLEFSAGSPSSSRVGACTFAFLPSSSSSVTLPVEWKMDLWLSLEAFPRGFPTGLSHGPPWCESILGLKVEAVLGKQVSLEWTDSPRETPEVPQDPFQDFRGMLSFRH